MAFVQVAELFDQEVEFEHSADFVDQVELDLVAIAQVELAPVEAVPVVPVLAESDPLDFDQVEFVLVVMLIELDWRDVVEFGGFVVLVPILVVLAQCLAEHQPFQVAGRVE